MLALPAAIKKKPRLKSRGFLFLSKQIIDNLYSGDVQFTHIMIKRTAETFITQYLENKNNSKILFIWGPRRSGKTTLLEKVSADISVPIFNFNLLSDQEPFVPRREILAKLAASHPVILIDEVQYFPESTVALKALHDEFKIKVIATGSSELRQKSKNFDSLADRYNEIFCLPLSLEETLKHETLPLYRIEEQAKQLAEDFQVFGSYPEVVTMRKTASEMEIADKLEKIVDAYILKDIIEIYELKNAKLAKDILTKIALQTGSEVSLREIASSLQANTATVANYIEIFIKNYILIALPSFKTNVRKAVSENRKLYFWDCGIRNALIKDFRKTELRPDKGGVFENLVISEVSKVIKNHRLKLNLYFYREYGGKEVDLVIEDYKKKYTVFEIKLTPQKAKPIFPLPHSLSTITPGNLLESLNKLTQTVL